MSFHPACWYSSTAPQLPSFPALEGEHSVDVCIVGAGLTGLSAALNLASGGLSVRVLEACTIGPGASGHAGGMLMPGCGLPFFPRRAGAPHLRLPSRRLQEIVDNARAFLPESGSDSTDDPSTHVLAAWKAGTEALDVLRSLIADHAIDCDFQASGHVRLATKPRHIDELKILARLMETCGHTGLGWYEGSDVGTVTGSERFPAALVDPAGGHLDPLKLVSGLARAATDKGVVFHENTPYLSHSVEKDGTVLVRTPWSRLRARWLIIAGNAGLWERGQVPGGTALPVNTFCAVTEPLGEDLARSIFPGNHAAITLEVAPERLHRTRDHRLLINGIYTGATVDPFNMRYPLMDRMRALFPRIPKEIRVTHSWGGAIAATRNRLPHFGRQGSQVLFAHGYSGHGLAMACFAGTVMARTIRQTEERFDSLAAIPHTPWPRARFLRTPSLLVALAALRLKDRSADLRFWWETREAERAARNAEKARTADTGPQNA